MVHFDWPDERFEVTGSAIFEPVWWVSPRQGTTLSFEDQQSMMTRWVCHWLINALPRRADEELVDALVSMFKFYRPREEQAAPALTASGRRAITKITHSVRPDVVIPDEG